MPGGLGLGRETMDLGNRMLCTLKSVVRHLGISRGV